MATPDDNILSGTVGNSVGGTPMGLIYQQLKIITIILRQGFNITDEDLSLLGQTPPTLNPAATPTNPSTL